MNAAMTQFTHKCVKPTCSNTYTDDDPDDYYCLTCNEERKVIAEQVDEKLKGNVATHTKSDLQIYDEIRERNGGIVKIQDLGIKL